MFCCGQIELAAGWGSTLSDLNDYLNVSYSGNETQLCVPSVLLKHTHTHLRERWGRKSERGGCQKGESDDTPNRWILCSSTWVPDEVILLWDAPFFQALRNLELNKCIVWVALPLSPFLSIQPFPFSIRSVSRPDLECFLSSLSLEKWESEGSELTVTEHQIQPNSF